LPTSFIVLWEGKIASVARILASKRPPRALSSEKTRSLRQTARGTYRTACGPRTRPSGGAALRGGRGAIGACRDNGRCHGSDSAARPQHPSPNRSHLAPTTGRPRVCGGLDDRTGTLTRAGPGLGHGRAGDRRLHGSTCSPVVRGARVTFAMSFDVPAWVSPGPQLLLWSLAGSDSLARAGATAPLTIAK